MSLVQRSLSNTFQRFFDSEKSGGILLIACTAVSLAVANSPIGADYLGWWQAPAGGLSIEHWINDALMWFLMLKSGVHATIAGVMLAFAIPFSARDEDEESPSHRLEHFLHRPVAFVILPIFALANTAIPVGMDWIQTLASANSAGIAAGLVVGKPLGITLFCFVAVASGLCRLPPDLDWRHVFGWRHCTASSRSRRRGITAA